ncbi:hypothetical protein Vadar_021686 [Vaccinium darrowii]|uniref:Uncharacterized protein n=1 Tax=Vaccinium darrowii TaxID=229202 RepID=A0ACB7ZLN8_9ERIC|nr:hypothetical protein Vadar_021686 [Vaccinium darrowii]
MAVISGCAVGTKDDGGIWAIAGSLWAVWRRCYYKITITHLASLYGLCKVQRGLRPVRQFHLGVRLSEKRREFISIEQDNSTSVDDYVARYTALSRFAPLMVSTEKDRCEHFLRGLNSRIQPRVSTFEEENFKKLVSKCKIAERDIQKADGKREQFKRSRVDTQSQQKGPGNKSLSWGGQSSQSIRSPPSQHTRFSADRGKSVSGQQQGSQGRGFSSSRTSERGLRPVRQFHLGVRLRSRLIRLFLKLSQYIAI